MLYPRARAALTTSHNRVSMGEYLTLCLSSWRSDLVGGSAGRCSGLLLVSDFLTLVDLK